jgi:hypothetical protein
MNAGKIISLHEILVIKLTLFPNLVQAGIFENHSVLLVHIQKLVIVSYLIPDASETELQANASICYREQYISLISILLHVF